MVAAAHMADVVVIAAHPHLEHSRVNRALLAAASALPARDVEVRELYALYPDYLIDVGAEQARLAQARLVVWQHPIQWYGMPALMKLWLDEVFAFGWAYGPGGEALRGKDLWLVASTGGTEAAYHPSGYNRYFFDAFLPPYEQAATLCGMRFPPPLVLHGAHRVDDATLDAHARLYASRLLSHPHWPEIASMEAPEKCEVPAAERPAGEVPAGGRPAGDT
ncbi:MAG TPA: NAD(P)H-dependent oxidoreductase [Ideonella sp.]|nr:NAD(P)H-dependent oxidoreductase [Ideonella sp.]